jgi:hypothetical protein
VRAQLVQHFYFVVFYGRRLCALYSSILPIYDAGLPDAEKLKFAQDIEAELSFSANKTNI